MIKELIANHLGDKCFQIEYLRRYTSSNKHFENGYYPISNTFATEGGGSVVVYSLFIVLWISGVDLVLLYNTCMYMKCRF